MSDPALREHVVYLLKGGDAHPDFEKAIAGVPEDLRGAKVNGVAHTPWHLLEHLRICQWDVLEFSRNSEHVSPEFPIGYWPVTDAPPETNPWNKSVQLFLDDPKSVGSTETSQ